MRLFSLILGCIATLSAIAPASADIINFSDLRKDAAEGVHVIPTGPEFVPFVPGWGEVYGSTAAFLSDTSTPSYYSGTLKFNNPATSITFDVDRANNSGWRNPITLVAFDHHKRVAATTVNLLPLGDMTHVTLSAPEIDLVQWRGTNWIIHPYIVRDVRVSFEPQSGSQVATVPNVGSPTPEPGACGIVAIAGAGMLLRRRR